MPRLDPKRARLVLGKIDQILAWERAHERERDTRFVEMGATCARCDRASTGGWRS